MKAARSTHILKKQGGEKIRLWDKRWEFSFSLNLS